MNAIVLEDGTRIIAERRSRATGTVIQVIDNRNSAFDANAGENPWYTVCLDHGGVCSHMTRQMALDWAPAPDQWCPGCRGPQGLLTVLGPDEQPLLQGVLDDAAGRFIDIAEAPDSLRAVDKDGHAWTRTLFSILKWSPA